VFFPGADSGQREKKKIGGEVRTENSCSARPWGRRAVTLVNESCLLVDHTGHSASSYVFRLSTRANSDRKNFTLKRHLHKTDFSWGYPAISPVQSPD
jgi:hypothetical protein